jgi:hypothetical protein
MEMATARRAGKYAMNEHLQHALERMAAVAERAGYLTRDEQEALAVRLETLADSLYWEQWFHLSDGFLVDRVSAETTDEVVLPQAAHGVPPAPSSLAGLTLVASDPTNGASADANRLPPPRVSPAGRK